MRNLHTDNSLLLWSRNIYSEASKADDVQFILDLIAKVGAITRNKNISCNNIGIVFIIASSFFRQLRLIYWGADSLPVR